MSVAFVFWAMIPITVISFEKILLIIISYDSIGSYAV